MCQIDNLSVRPDVAAGPRSSFELHIEQSVASLASLTSQKGRDGSTGEQAGVSGNEVLVA